MKVGLIVALLVLPIPVSLAVAPPVCSEVFWPYEMDCGAAAGSVSLVATQACWRVDPSCEDPNSWGIAAQSCMMVPGSLAVEWEFVLSDVPAFAGVAQSVPTEDPDCPHLALFTATHNGGTFHLPYECVRAQAVSAGGVAAVLVCEST